MGQCSSSGKHKQRQKTSHTNELRFPFPDDDEDEIVLPPAGEAPARRRALDDGVGAMRTEGNGLRAGPIKEADESVDEFGLRAVRASVDNDTCAALLALRMGRGSSVARLIRDEDRRSNGSSLRACLEAGSETCQEKLTRRLSSSRLEEALMPSGLDTVANVQAATG